MTNYVQKLLGELLTKYKDEPTTVAGETIELELRFKDITRDAFEDIYKHISASPEFTNPQLECSTNFISENVYERGGKDSKRYIRRLNFVKGVVVSDTYYQKERLVRSVQISDYLGYSVGLSRETPSKKFPTNNDALVRFKARVSFDYVVPGQPAQWRFDLTATKSGTLTELASVIKTIKNSLFAPALSHDNFLRELNHDFIDAYEVEIEHIGGAKNLTIEDLNIAKKIFSMINPQYTAEMAYQEEIYHVAQYVVSNQNKLHLFKNPTHRLKQLGNPVFSLSKNAYYADIYPPTGYYLTDKADGYRAIASINGNRCRIILSHALIEFQEGEFEPGPITIADCELIYTGEDGSTGGDRKFTLYVFDPLVNSDDNISRLPFENRIVAINEVSELLNTALAKHGNRAIAKKYVMLADNLESQFREVWDAKYPYELDGLILTAPGDPYSDTKNYKWKPYSHNTIDFLAVKCPRTLLGIRPYDTHPDKELYILCVGISHSLREKIGMGLIPNYKSMFPSVDASYYPIQFSPSANLLAYLYYHDKAEDIDRKIIELSRDETNTNWIFHKVRTDRTMEKHYFGNDFRVAEMTYLNYVDPFNFEDLWKPSDSYFVKNAGTMYTSSNKFKRFVISLLLKDNLSGVKWVIDEAAGRGADLHRYQEIGIENALFMDIDPTAIAELVRRKFAFFAVKKRFVRKGGSVVMYDRVHDIEYDKLFVKDMKSMTIHTLVADLKSPAKELVANTFQFGLNTGMVDGIVCNFAIHYMCDTIEHIRNLLIFNATMLKIGGLFIFTTMDGKTVFDLLKDVPVGKQWESQQDGRVKYAIAREYAGDKLTPCGQMISVLLPFSDEMYQEPLCNIETVIAEAGKLGFEVELNANMNTFLDKFYKADRALFDKLTPEDKHYIGLHKFVSLRLIKRVKGL